MENKNPKVDTEIENLSAVVDSLVMTNTFVSEELKRHDELIVKVNADKISKHIDDSIKKQETINKEVIKKFEDEIEPLTNELKCISEFVEIQQKMNAGFDKSVKTNKKDINSFKTKVKTIETELKKQTEELTNISKKIDMVKTLKNTVSEMQKTIDKQNETINKFDKKLKEFSKLYDDTYKKEQQSIIDNVKTVKTREINLLNSRVDTLDTYVKQTVEDMGNSRKTKDVKMLKEQVSTVEEFIKQQDEVNRDVEHINVVLDSLFVTVDAITDSINKQNETIQQLMEGNNK